MKTAPSDSPSAPVSGSATDRLQKTVVIVEDDTGLREELVRLLGLVPDLECLYAVDNAEQALLKIPKQTPDVVLMDINLPGMSGIECVEILKKSNESLEIIMLTVYQDFESIFRALKAGANGYLLKSSNPEDLYAAIRDISKGGSPLTTHIARKVVKHFREEKKAFTPAKQSLSRRELEVLELLAEGFRYKEIAQHLCVSIETIKTHVKNICAKMHVKNRIEAIVKLRHTPD